MAAQKFCSNITQTTAAKQYFDCECSKAPHMRSRLPTVWSSRCSVKVAAFSTLVSFSREILQQEQGQTLSFQALPRTSSYSRRSRAQGKRCAL